MKRALIETIIETLKAVKLVDLITVSTQCATADAKLTEVDCDVFLSHDEWKGEKVNFRFAHVDGISKAQRISVFPSKLEINNDFRATYSAVGTFKQKSNYFIDGNLVTDALLMRAIDECLSAQKMLIFRKRKSCGSLFDVDFSVLGREYTEKYGSTLPKAQRKSANRRKVK